MQYALFVSEEAKSLPDKIVSPLRSIQINLGIEIRSAVLDLQSVLNGIESFLNAQSAEESRIHDWKLLQQVGKWLSPMPSARDFEAFTLG